MSPDFFCHFLLWSLAINYAILLTWFVVFMAARNWLRALHGRWFQLSNTAFDTIHYGGMAIYKIGILLFNLAPLLALYFVGSGS